MAPYILEARSLRLGCFLAKLEPICNISVIAEAPLEAPHAPWTVAIGGTAPAPTGSASAQASAASAAPGQASTQCDSNIAVSGAADCAFAENTFYEYWSNQGSGSVQVYSAQDGQMHSVSCGSALIISCTSDQGATVTFPQSAVGSYTQSQADHYAATHKVAP